MKAAKETDINDQPIIGLMPAALSIEYVPRDREGKREVKKVRWITRIWRRMVAFGRRMLARAGFTS
jgi:hypothetical protein